MGMMQGFLFGLIIALCFLASTGQLTGCQDENLAFDIVFLVDSSSSIANRQFREMKAFIRQVVNGLNIDSKKVQVGIVQFSIDPRQEFLLGDYTNKADLLQKIDKITLQLGGTFMGKAMTFLRESYFTSAGGSRIDQKVPQIVVVVTDGGSKDDIKGPAKDLRAKGVIIFAIAVGETNMANMRSIANIPPEHFVLNIENYAALKGLTTTMMETVCTLMRDQGKAIAPKFADVFVLVDSSATTWKQDIRKILTELAENLKVGDGSNKIALAQFGENVVKEFLFSDYKDTAKAKEYINRFEPRPNGDRKLGNAMDYVRTNFLNAASGSRIDNGYKQHVLVMRAGESSDSVLGATRIMKNEDVTVIDIKLESNLGPLTPVIRGYNFQQNVKQIVLDITKRIETKEVFNVTGDCTSAQVADIVFIVDESTSITLSNFDLVKNFLHRIVSGLEVKSDSVRVGLVRYSSKPSVGFYLNSFENKIEILNYIKLIPKKGGGTQTGAALKFAKENLFTQKSGSRKALGIKQIAIVITDGESQDDVTNAASELRRSGVNVYAVGVESASRTELIKIASYPERQFVFNVENFQMLTRLEKSLRKSLCKTVVDRVFDKNKIHTLKQACVNTEEADIYFLLDTSRSTRADFEDVKKFILYLLKLFSIGEFRVRAGIIKADRTPVLQFNVQKHKNRVSLESNVLNMIQPSGGTEMTVALEFAAERFKEAKASRKANVQNILIVITDKKSQDDVSDPADELRNLGVLVYAVGVRDAAKDELLKMADVSKVFFVPNYDVLNDIKAEILTDICAQEACKNQVADVIFLIDGSSSIVEKDFISMKTFINKVVNGSVVGKDDVHFGLVQFSTNTKEHFPLDKFYNKTALQDEIQNINQLTLDTYIGKALSFVSPYFDVGRGGRPGISQFLVVITDGEAHDKEVIDTNARAIRDKGVVIYSIGVGKADVTQLEEISGTKDRVYVEKDFDALQSIDKDLQFKLCFTSTVCQNKQLADVIFLVQCTRQIRSQDIQKTIRNFLISVVNSTQIGDNLIRIGVIVYSDTPNQFTLNKYNSKRQVLDSIKDLSYSTGNAYTAKALEYSLPFFAEEHGGRQKRNIPQILYLITDGPAIDRNKLNAQAKEYESKNIQVYGIGVGNVQRSDLESITKNKSKVFQVDRYEALQSLKENISSVLCHITKPECLNEVADLVFLIDGSESIKKSQWNIMIAFLLNIMDKLPLQPNLYRIGVAQFSRTYQKEFYLNEYKDVEGVKAAIKQIKQLDDTTYTGAALRDVVEFFQETKGSRKLDGIPQNLVLITDGEAKDDVAPPVDVLRNMNISIFAIGIGEVSVQNLSYIAGSPDRLFMVPDFDHLKLTTETFVDAICMPIKPVPYDEKSCSIDIAIGFDNSQNSLSSSSIFRNQRKLESYLPEIVRYMSVLENLCCVPKPTINTNIGFRLVSANGEKLRDYPFEEYSIDVVEKVMKLQTTQKLEFNSKLLGSFQDMLKASNAYVKVVIIFTDGLDKPVEELLLASEKLRNSGVHALLTVALDGFRNTADLQRLEFGRGIGYKQLLSIGMQNVASVMQKEIDTVASRVCCNVLCKCTGHQGVPGPYGFPGAKGLHGQMGSPGFPGEEGEVGRRGPPGLNGTQGHQGCHGRRGIKGGRGYRGENGDAGEDGLNGVDGEQGITGVAGGPGERGDPGSPGPDGIRGNTGDTGQKGLRGDPGSSGLDNNFRGSKGDIGSPGIHGEPGPDGIAGEAGDVGRPGSNGKRGSVGEQGSRGPPAEPGQQGLPGASGPMGALGPPGTVGQRGFPGLPGPQGSFGSSGRPGSKGGLGSRGQKGQPGEPGDNGAFGPPGIRGLPGKDGADGYGLPGPDGQKGDNGFPGYPGRQGEQGDSGTNGGPGLKGNRGRGGNAGRTGPSGDPGSQGLPGHRGSKGRPGTRELSDCQLISYVRDNCLCCKGNPKCPAYPTDIVIGLDMSQDVTPQAFERMRSTVLTLLDNINIAESNCPTGARVAVVSYSAHTKYLIRFADYQRKQQLIQAVKYIALERTTNQRQIASAMRFVSRNMFKRVRKATLMRKVAIFLSGGEAQNKTSLITAILEYKALDIKLGIIGLRNDPTIRSALEVDESKSFIFTVLGRPGDQKASLSKIQNCVICFDPCTPARECEGTNLQPSSQEVDLDLAVIVDGSRSILADQYEGVKEVLGSVLDQIIVSSQPDRADGQARVALYQQSSTYSEAQSGVKVIFNFQQLKNRSLMKRSIHEELKQTGGSSKLGLAIEYAIKMGFRTAPKGRKNKMVLAIIGEDTAYYDRAKLDFISGMAKCEGVVLFTVTVGDHYNSTQVEEIASYPLEQHIVHLGNLKHGEQEYAQRFMRTFFHILSKDMNSYPPPSLQRQCSNFPGRGVNYEPAERPVHSVPFPATPSPTAEVEQETEETKDLQSSGRRDSLELADHEGSQCHLTSDRGFVCGEYVQRWYYNGVIGACLPFWYGGCGGNSNRFASETECLQTCGTHSPELQKDETIHDDACLMEQDVGPCNQYVLKWHYDIHQNECVYFWFGGCKGNKNRFDTQEQCEALCVRKI